MKTINMTMENKDFKFVNEIKNRTQDTWEQFIVRLCKSFIGRYMPERRNINNEVEEF